MAKDKVRVDIILLIKKEEVKREFMRVVFLIVLTFIISCKPKDNVGNDQMVKVDSVNIETHNEISDENFDDFFNKFRTDSLFQLQRIDKPLSVIKSDEEAEEEEKQVVKYVSFDQKDWDIKIEYKKTILSKDTMNVVLEGIDTGVHIEHFFVMRQGNWYLFQIKNLSD